MPLPFSIRGSPVGLLIGLQNITMNPVLIGILPSGLGVYRSVFTDVYGSNISFGGPQPFYSKAFQTLLMPPPHCSSTRCPFSRTRYTNIWYCLILKMLPVLLSLKRDVLPISKPLVLNNEVYPPTIDNSCLEYHLCGNKALITISKINELVDQDISDVITYWCLDCSKCLTCKCSNKLNATSN